VKEPILYLKQRNLARTASNLLYGIELDEFEYYAYIFNVEVKNELQCCMFVGPHSVVHGASFSPALVKNLNALDTVVRLARYTSTIPSDNPKYLDWRDSSEAIVVDELLERYEDLYSDALIRLFNAYYCLRN
jgi:hypothetical protein